MTVRIKICGITRVDDALQAARLGADAIGLVFYEKSPRLVSICRAQEIIAKLPPFISLVALFVNPSVLEVERVIKSCAIDILQFHGDESAAFCRSFARPYLKAVRMREAGDLLYTSENYFDARAILVDSFVEGSFGGNGQSFDWSLLPEKIGRPLVLSGGLDASNVRQAIQQVNPMAVDVSSGVEQYKGIKNAVKMAAFISEVKNAFL